MVDRENRLKKAVFQYKKGSYSKIYKLNFSIKDFDRVYKMFYDRVRPSSYLDRKRCLFDLAYRNRVRKYEH